MAKDDAGGPKRAKKDLITLPGLQERFNRPLVDVVSLPIIHAIDFSRCQESVS
jgi:hypothetical protein